MIAQIISDISKRQIFGEAAQQADENQDGQDDSVDEDGAAAAATYNNGMWTPPAIASLASPTMSTLAVTTPLIATSIADITLPNSVSSTAPASSSTSQKLAASTATRPATSSSVRSTLSSSGSSSTSSASPTSASSHNSNGGFRLVYLVPIVVFVGLLLLFSVVGRIWGRIHHASRLEAARRAKYDKRASRQAKKREMQRIKTMWGYDKTPMLAPELEPGEHDLHYKDPGAPLKKHQEGDDAGESSFGSDSESGLGQDEKYPGTFKILSLALLGEGSKPAPPISRNESGKKYEAEMQGNSWLAVKIRRWVRRNEKDEVDGDGKYSSDPYRTATAASRRLRHALSRERLHSAVSSETWYEKDSASSPATTLPVRSGELKHKAEFEAVDLGDGTDQAYGLDDPFIEKAEVGYRKPLPDPPKESPFRPAIMNFGLRSRSKTYDPVSLRDAAPEHDTPQKPAPSSYIRAGDEDGAASGLLPKSFGLGISGVWKAVTGFGTPTDPCRQNGNEDEESFVARPYGAYEEVMSESDTPYSVREHSRYGESCTPTRITQLARVGTVLNVKSTTNQPWNAIDNSAKRMTTAAFNEALLASPVNKQQQHAFQPIALQYPASVTSSPSRSPTKGGGLQTLAPQKSLLLRQAIVANQGVLSPPRGDSPAFTDYSDLVACYSTPSDAVMSPEVAQSVRALPPTAKVSSTSVGEGARAKLQRAKTSKGVPAQAVIGVQRSKTASTASTSDPGLSRKGTLHHSVHKRQQIPELTDDDGGDLSKRGDRGLYPHQLTQPLRLNKQGDTLLSAVTIPNRGSSSPSKSQAAWGGIHGTVPSALRIASPEPLLPSPIRESRHKQQLSYDVSSAYSQDVIFRGFASFESSADSSPPKRAKAVSNRSVESDTSDRGEGGMARTAVQKARNRSEALLTVDQIVSQSYASQLPFNDQQRR